MTELHISKMANWCREERMFNGRWSYSNDDMRVPVTTSHRCHSHQGVRVIPSSSHSSTNGVCQKSRQGKSYHHRVAEPLPPPLPPRNNEDQLHEKRDPQSDPLLYEKVYNEENLDHPLSNGQMHQHPTSHLLPKTQKHSGIKKVIVFFVCY